MTLANQADTQIALTGANPQEPDVQARLSASDLNAVTSAVAFELARLRERFDGTGDVALTDAVSSVINQLSDLDVNSSAAAGTIARAIAEAISEINGDLQQLADILAPLIDHLNILNIGTNSHAAIDTHIALSIDPHGSSMTVSSTVTTPKIASPGQDFTLDMPHVLPKTMFVKNTGGSDASLDVQNDIIVGGTVDGLDLQVDIVKKALFDAQTILAATLDNTPVALAVAASRILGRKSTGDIAAMTAAEAKTVLQLKHAFPIRIDAPAVDDDFQVFKVHTDVPITITKVFGETDGAGGETCDFNLYWRVVGSGFAGLANKILTADLQATNAGATTTTFDDATIPGNSWIVIRVSAVSGDTKVLGAVEFTVD